MKVSGLVMALVLVTVSGSAWALESGGLAPPAPLQREPYAQPQSTTEMELARADREDSGRGLEFVWLNAEAGYQFVGLETFNGSKLLPGALTDTTQSGVAFGGGAGARLLFFTLGGRFRMGSFSAWDLWSVDLEAGFHLPYGSLEPYAYLGGGYCALGSFEARRVGELNAKDLEISGWNLRAGLGLDYYLSSVFSVGALLSGDILFLTRSKLAGIPSDTPDDLADPYGSDGKSIGGAGSLTGVLGLHF